MDITGERYSPQIPVPEISYEHWHRYLYASQFVAGKTVLDLACGEGYGSNLFAQTAARVVGVDISQEAINHASSVYMRPNLAFERAPASAIPIQGEAVFDVIVSFEMIEHLDEPEQQLFLAEVKRLLKPDGILLISTPNKLLYTDRPNYHNEFHVREFYPNEFIAFLRAAFGTVRVLGQHIYPVSYLWPLEPSAEPQREYQIAYASEQYEPLASDKKEVLYLVALCSNGDITVPAGSVMLDISDQAISQRIRQIEDKERHITNITQQVRDERAARAGLEDDIRALHERLHQTEIHADEIAKVAAYHEQRASNLQQHTVQIEQRNVEQQRTLAERNRELELLSGALEEAQQQLAEREQQFGSLQMQMELFQREAALMQSGIGYTILTSLRNWRWQVMPQGSRSNTVYLKMRRVLLLWLNFGFGFVIRKAVARPLRAIGLKRAANTLATPKITETRRAALRTSDSVGTSSLPDSVFMRSPDTLYSQWLDANTPSVEELTQQRIAAPQLRGQPLISIITPVYNVAACWLEKCVESVLAQTYPNWELCIVDDASTKPHVRPLLQELAARDARIKVRYAEENQGIAGASNQCLDMATGEFVAFLDNDDELAPHALFTIVERLQYAPETDVLYSDEDKISPQNHREQPFFKPDFSYDLLLSNNYFCHLLVIRKKLVEQIGGFRTGFDGAQDYDLIMRALEHTTPRNILHIADVLYHWRIIAGSTATDYNSKPHAVTASLKLLDEHLTHRLGADYGVVEAVEATPTATVYHPRYAVKTNPLVSIVIGTKDKVDILAACIKSLEKTTYSNYEIIIVDNNSKEPATLSYFEKIATNPRIRVMKYPFPFNYSALNNAGIGEAQGDVIVLLNNDTELITPDWLEIMVGLVEQPRVGAIGVQLLYPNKTIQHAGVILGLGGVAGHSHKYYPAAHSGYFNMLKTLRNYSAVTAACLMFRRAVWEEVGGLNEQLVVTFNDIDFCLKIGAAGYDIVYTPQVKLWHHESISVGRVHRKERVMDPREMGYMKWHWASVIAYDPFYNPNLTLDYENYSIQPWRRRPTPYPNVATNDSTPELTQLTSI